MMSYVGIVWSLVDLWFHFNY